MQNWPNKGSLQVANEHCETSFDAVSHPVNKIKQTASEMGTIRSLFFQTQQLVQLPVKLQRQ